MLKNNKNSGKGFSRSVQIPAEASAMAVKGNSPFAAVLLFPGMFEVKIIKNYFHLANISENSDIHIMIT